MFDFLMDYTVIYVLFFAAFLFSIFTSITVNSTFSKYNKVISSRGMPVSVIARQILDSNGLYNVNVVRTAGNLTDHYDPRTNTIALSQTVYDSCSVGAIGVAAHEVGHAIQYATGYVPIKIRMAILPVAQFGSHAWIIIFILGIVFRMPILREIGIVLFAFIVLFQLITLPVEFNASNRAIKTIDNQGILIGSELTGAKRTLRAAAMTYVASLALAIVQLLRLLASSRRN